MPFVCLIIAIVLFVISAFPGWPPESKYHGSLVPLGLAFFAGSFAVPA